MSESELRCAAWAVIDLAVTALAAGWEPSRRWADLESANATLLSTGDLRARCWIRQEFSVPQDDLRDALQLRVDSPVSGLSLRALVHRWSLDSATSAALLMPPLVERMARDVSVPMSASGR